MNSQGFTPELRLFWTGSMQSQRNQVKIRCLLYKLRLRALSILARQGRTKILIDDILFFNQSMIKAWNCLEFFTLQYFSLTEKIAQSKQASSHLALCSCKHLQLKQRAKQDLQISTLFLHHHVYGLIQTLVVMNMCNNYNKSIEICPTCHFKLTSSLMCSGSFLPSNMLYFVGISRKRVLFSLSRYDLGHSGTANQFSPDN